MKYIAFYKAKDDPKRNFCISYAVCEDNNSFIIKSFVEDGSFSEKAFIGNCGKEKAKEILLDIGYNRMGFYFFPFEKTFPKLENRTHEVKEGTTISENRQNFIDLCSSGGWNYVMNSKKMHIFSTILFFIKK